jgi:hypothetical protein
MPSGAERALRALGPPDYRRSDIRPREARMRASKEYHEMAGAAFIGSVHLTFGVAPLGRGARL